MLPRHRTRSSRCGTIDDRSRSPHSTIPLTSARSQPRYDHGFTFESTATISPGGSIAIGPTPDANPSTTDAGAVRRNARDIVIRRLASELRRRPAFGLAPLAVDGLDHRDSALAHAIYTEAIRRLLTVEYLLGQKLNQPFANLEARLQAALIAGATQILCFDHLPDYAVVDETVTWVGRNVREKAKGLANAVLRRIIEMRGEMIEAKKSASTRSTLSGIPLSDGRILQLTHVNFPDDPLERLSTLTSHPLFLIRAWQNQFGRDELVRLLLHNLVQPPTILVDVPPGIHDDRLGPHRDARFTVWHGNHTDLAEFLHRFPDCRVQDPSSFAVCESTRQLKLAGRTIIDVCAGSGTKSAQIASIHPHARIIATEVDDRRREILRRRFEEHERVSVITPERLIHFAGEAALILLDVPCSNSGVLARRIEAKYRFDADNLRSLVNLQRQIIANSLTLRAPDGIILYSTCSIESQENEAQAQWIEKWHGLRTRSQQLRLPTGLPGDPASAYADGGYHALIG